MKYTDLHLHLDGSLPVETVINLAALNSIPLPSANPALLLSSLAVPKDCASLNEYLKSFELPKLLTQNLDSLRISILDIAKKLKALDVEYAEIRFAPQFHQRNGLSQYDIVCACEAYAKEATKLFGVQIRIILCIMRGASNMKENMETCEIAAAFDRDIIAGLDLAGAEALYPTKDYEEIFKRANSLGIPFTIHAGEAAGPESIWSAIKFGAKRIGHGIAAIQDKELLKYLAESDIAIELCPTSNLQTKAVTNILDYPLRTYLDLGIKATINSDNMTVSNTSVKDEFEFMQRVFSLTADEILLLNENAKNSHL